jgi:hypothetical protein
MLYLDGDFFLLYFGTEFTEVWVLSILDLDLEAEEVWL